MKRTILLVPAMLIAASALGCDMKMNRQQYRVNQSFHDVVGVAMEGVQAFEDSYIEVEAARAAMETSIVTMDIDNEFDSHTRDGVLVSTTQPSDKYPDGIAPMSRNELNRLLGERDKRMRQLVTNQERNKQAAAKIRKIREALVRANDAWMNDNTTWIEKQESIAAVVNSTVNAVAGAAAGYAATVGIPLKP